MWFYCFYSIRTTVVSSSWMMQDKTHKIHGEPNANNTVICILSSHFLIKSWPTSHNIVIAPWGWLICCVKQNQMPGNFSLRWWVQQMSGSCGLVWKLRLSLNSSSLSYSSPPILWGGSGDVLLYCTKAARVDDNTSLHEVWLTGGKADWLIEIMGRSDYLFHITGISNLSGFGSETLNEADWCFHLEAFLVSENQWFPAVSSR